MKKLLIPILLILLFVACDKKNETEKAIKEIPVELEVVRFDKVFFESKPEDLPRIKEEYPLFFPSSNDDTVWVEKMQNPLWRDLYSEVQKKFSDFDPIKVEIEEVFKHIEFYFPKTKTPKVVTVISEMDYNNKIIYADSLLIISLEMYLGKDHKFYQFSEYLKQNFESSQIMPDIVSSYYHRIMAPNRDKSFLSNMIFAGKELYLKDLILPQYNDDVKIGYSAKQLNWCVENESYIWRYFVEESLLYSDDQKLNQRFINKAPFSKFYLEIDNESPGRVGAWIGWQIVRSYMKNNHVTIGQLLNANAKEIFEKSKYKPKK